MLCFVLNVHASTIKHPYAQAALMLLRGFAICPADQPAQMQTKAQCMTLPITCVTFKWKCETEKRSASVLLPTHYNASLERFMNANRDSEVSPYCSNCGTVRELITVSGMKLVVTAFCNAGSFIIHWTALWLNAFMLHVISLFMKPRTETIGSISNSIPSPLITRESPRF